jgi:hypothetical protein
LLSGSLLLRNPIFYRDLLSLRLALISLRFDKDIILASFYLLAASLPMISLYNISGVSGTFSGWFYKVSGTGVLSEVKLLFLKFLTSTENNFLA